MAAHRIALLAVLLPMRLVLAESIPPPAYQLAAERAGVPATVLFAVTLQESGTVLHGQRIPWPWTLNIAGQGQRYPTRDAACQGIHKAARQHDLKRIDVGLGQTNLGHNGARYSSPCAALDPQQNLIVTATLLREHYDLTGDWVQAAGRYHRPAGGAIAARYRAQFRQQLQQLQASTSPTLESSP